MSNILLIDDDEVFCEAACSLIAALGHDVKAVHTLEHANAVLNNEKFDHLIVDFMLPDGSGLHVIDEYRNRIDPPKLTIVTGHPAIKTVVSGLCDHNVNYLIKPINRDKLEQILSPKAAAASAFTHHFDTLIGESAPMKQLYSMIERVAKTNANVMLMGESGVGKEVVAKAIHTASNTEGPLVAANCGAFSKDLIGSELFGHEKGAFTGAVARKAGFFEQADGGSLFLDEITEMPMDSQPNLLRVLETGRVTRVGATKDFSVSCRVISATNRSEEDLAESNVLREDLYFRLAVFPIRIPALRERKDDIELLARAFLEKLNQENNTQFDLSDRQVNQLTEYEWPGNVRELRHAIHRAFIMSDRESNTFELPTDLASPFSKSGGRHNTVTAGRTIDDVEKELIEITLQNLEGDKPKAAEMLGISLKTLYNRLNKYQSEFT